MRFKKALDTPIVFFDGEPFTEVTIYKTNYRFKKTGTDIRKQHLKLTEKNQKNIIDAAVHFPKITTGGRQTSIHLSDVILLQRF